MSDLPAPAMAHPLADLPDSVREALLPRMRMRTLEPGDVLISQGHDATTAYVVIDGAFDVRRDGRTVARCTRGELVGVLGLFVGSRSTASVVATARSRVAEMDRVSFSEILEAVPTWSEQIREQARHRFDEVRIRAALSACPGLPAETHDALARSAELVEYGSGDPIVLAGEASDAWWLILSGRAVTDEASAAHFVHGDLVGVRGVLTRAPCDFTVRARTPVVAVRWPAAAFEEVVAPDPVAVRQVASQALAGPRRRGRSEARVVAVVSDGPRLATPIAHTHLVLGLGRAVRVATAHAARELGLDLEAPELDRMQEARLSLWLEERASAASLTLVEVPDPQSAWGRWALRVADRCLIVTRSEGYRGPPIHTSAERHLVMLHPPSVGLPMGTRAHMEAVGATEVSHLQQGRRQDIERLARRLAGREVSVVLAGGGARGYAHIGVLHALRHYGIPIDRVGGTSSGAIVAAFAGRGDTLEDTMALLARLQERGGPTKARVSASSLLDRDHTLWSAETLWEGRDLEDLWLPVFCVTANLDTAQATILERGDLGVATRATAAVPVALPPVRVGEHWLIDGGIIDNYPVGPMRARVGPGGRVIGVNLAVNPKAILDREPGWFERILLRRKEQDPPHILDVLYRAVQVATTGSARNEGEVDLEMEVDSTDVDPRAFDRYHEIIQDGLDQAMVRLAALEAEGRLEAFRDALPLPG